MVPPSTRISPSPKPSRLPGSSFPAETVVVPRYVLSPLRIRVPSPCLRRPPVPEMEPANDESESPKTDNVSSEDDEGESPRSPDEDVNEDETSSNTIFP